MTKVYSYRITFGTVANRYIRRKLISLDDFRIMVNDVACDI